MYRKFMWPGVTLIIVLVIGTIGYWIIGGKQYSLVDTLYMTVITITTVGFGDVVPYTKIGRTIILLVISLGLLVIPWNTGILIKHIVYSISKIKVICPKCGLMYHDRDAKYCKNCGGRIYIEYKKPGE